MADQLRAIGIRFIIGTLAGIAFAVVGAALGPTTLVVTLLGIGALLIVVAHFLRTRSQQERSASTLKEY